MHLVERVCVYILEDSRAVFICACDNLRKNTLMNPNLLTHSVSTDVHTYTVFVNEAHGLLDVRLCQTAHQAAVYIRVCPHTHTHTYISQGSVSISFTFAPIYTYA